MAESPSPGYDPDAFAKAKERRALDLEELATALTGTLARRLGVTEVEVRSGLAAGEQIVVSSLDPFEGAPLARLVD